MRRLPLEPWRSCFAACFALPGAGCTGRARAVRGPAEGAVPRPPARPAPWAAIQAAVRQPGPVESGNRRCGPRGTAAVGPERRAARAVTAGGGVGGTRPRRAVGGTGGVAGRGGAAGRRCRRRRAGRPRRRRRGRCRGARRSWRRQRRRAGTGGGSGAGGGGSGAARAASHGVALQRRHARLPGTYFVDATAGRDSERRRHAGDSLADADQGERDDVPGGQRALLQGGRRLDGHARAQGLGLGRGADRRRSVRHRRQAAHRRRRERSAAAAAAERPVLGGQQPRAHQHEERARRLPRHLRCAAATRAC